MDYHTKYTVYKVSTNSEAPVETTEIVWREGKITSCLKQQAESAFIPKEKTEHITQIRTISLSNVRDVFLSTDKKNDSIHDVEGRV